MTLHSLVAPGGPADLQNDLEAHGVIFPKYKPVPNHAGQIQALDGIIYAPPLEPGGGWAGPVGGD